MQTELYNFLFYLFQLLIKNEYKLKFRKHQRQYWATSSIFHRKIYHSQHFFLYLKKKKLGDQTAAIAVIIHTFFLCIPKPRTHKATLCHYSNIYMYKHNIYIYCLTNNPREQYKYIECNRVNGNSSYQENGSLLAAASQQQ